MHIYLARFFERHSSKVVWRRELPEYTRDNQINRICLRTFIIHWLQFQARNWMHNSLASRSMYNNKSSIFQCYFLLSVNVWRIKVFSLGIDRKNEEIKFLSFFGTFFIFFAFQEMFPHEMIPLSIFGTEKLEQRNLWFVLIDLYERQGVQQQKKHAKSELNPKAKKLAYLNMKHAIYSIQFHSIKSVQR